MSTSRNHRRQLRRQLPPKSPSAAPSRQLHERMAVLEDRLGRFEALFDGNMSALTDSLKMMEGMQYVLQRVMNDVQEASPLTLPSGKIDFHAYLLQYWSCMAASDFFFWVGSLAPKKEEEHGPDRILLASQDDTIIFGG